MVSRISADFEVLLDQAGMTAAQYMRVAARSIDAQFGDGYAAAHPELVAAFMRTAAQDFHTAVMGAVVQDATDVLAVGAGELGQQLVAGLKDVADAVEG